MMAKYNGRRSWTWAFCGRLAQQLEDPTLHAHSLNRLGNWLVNTGQVKEGLEAHQQALDVFQGQQDRAGMAQTFDLLGMALAWSGDLVKGRQQHERAIALFRLLGDNKGLISTLPNASIGISPVAAETVFVVGARCAGAPTAMLLGRKGYRVLLVDRDIFPSDHMSTHWIHQPGVARLERWGLRERLAATGCPPITSINMDLGPFALRGTPPAGDVAEAYCPRRTVLDKLLVDAAVESGVELREQFSVQNLVWDGDRVSGITGRSAIGTTVTEQARIVIGADGVHSLVARQVEAPTYNTKPTFACAYYSYWSGVPLDGVEFYPRQHRGFGVLPTHHGLTAIIVGWPHDEFHTYRADIERNFLKTLELAPAFAERVRRRRWGGSWVPQHKPRPERAPLVASNAGGVGRMGCADLE
jgi:hypothetical protein